MLKKIYTDEGNKYIERLYYKLKNDLESFITPKQNVASIQDFIKSYRSMNETEFTEYSDTAVREVVWLELESLCNEMKIPYEVLEWIWDSNY